MKMIHLNKMTSLSDCQWTIRRSYVCQMLNIFNIGNYLALIRGNSFMLMFWPCFFFIVFICMALSVWPIDYVNEWRIKTNRYDDACATRLYKVIHRP